MIMKEVTIKEVYTSEDGTIFWVRGKVRDEKYKIHEIGLGGCEDLKSALRYANNFMKKFGLKELKNWYDRT